MIRLGFIFEALGFRCVAFRLQLLDINGLDVSQLGLNYNIYAYFRFQLYLCLFKL